MNPRIVITALFLSCAGASTVSPLANTPLERGAKGPYVASLEWSRHDASAVSGRLAQYQVTDGERAGELSLWESAAIAPAASPQVERFDVPVWIDNGHDNTIDGQMVVLVSLPLPFFHPRGIVESKIVDRVPEYQALAALNRKYFTVMEPARFGGIYLWRDEASARAYFDDAWRAQAKAKYGAEAEVRFLRVLSVSIAHRE